MTELTHSLYSASAASRWISCPGSIVLSKGMADSASRHAAWGTVAHRLADWALDQGRRACHDEWRGAVHSEAGFEIVVDQEMVECVDAYLAHAGELAADADMTWSEQRVNYARWLEVDEPMAWGTLDFSAVWIDQKHLLILDLKTGRGVEVSPDGNEQGMLYAGGKLLELDALGIEVDTIDIAISQPRTSRAPKVWRVTRAELEHWLTGRARSGAASVAFAYREYDDPKGAAADWHQTFLRPGEKACRWCKAKATCPALRAEVAETVGASEPASPDDFLSDMQPTGTGAYEAADWLAACLSKVDLIEDWCAAVRAEAHRRLTEGENVPGYKLVQGKRGARAWTDEAQAEEVLRKQMRLPVEKAFNLKLITPPQAEKLAKAGDIGPRQWPKLAALITQKDGQPSVAPASDPRPAITVQPVDEAFEIQADDIA